MQRIGFHSLRRRLLFLFGLLAIFIGLIDFAGSQLVIQQELSVYTEHVRQDQIDDWARVLSALYVEHGDSWTFLALIRSPKSLFPIDGLVLGHTQYRILSNHKVLISYPENVKPQSTWLTSPIVVMDQSIGTLFVRPTVSPPLAQLSHQLFSFFSLLQGFCIIVAITLSTLIAIQVLRRVLQPLEQLTVAAKGITRHIFDLPIPVGEDREVAEVLNAFRMMQTHLTMAQEARERLLADVMHELRTPITIIANQIESVQLGISELKDEQLTVLYDEMIRMGTVLSDLQQLSDAQAGVLKLNVSRVDLVELLVNMREIYQVDCKVRGITCTIDSELDSEWSLIDRRRVTQVLVNLMTNAMKFTPDGGRIEWHLRKNRDRGGGIQIAIRDQGLGIAAEHLPYLFERFYRVDHSRCRDTGGSGLGLAIVKEIVEQHGGSVFVKSIQGEGSTFGFTLPASRLE